MQDNHPIVIETYHDLWKCTRYMTWWEFWNALTSYLTIWTWVVVFIVPFLFSRGTRLLLIIFVAIGGLYVSRIHPREISVGRFVFRGNALFFLDVLLHQLPLLMVLLWRNTDIHDRDFVVFLSLVLFYFYLENPIVRYRLRQADLVWICLCITVAFPVLLTHLRCRA